SVTAAATQAVEAGNVSAAEKTSEAAMASAADGSGAHRQTGLNAEFDGAFAIKAQATTNGPGTVQAQKQSEVAFAARIAERTAAVAHVSTTSPVVTAGAPVTAAPSTAAPGAGNSSSAKAAADDRVPQFLEPQNEPSQRAGDSVRDISLKLTNKDQSSVQVRLSERAGELHVSVRTPDAGLTRGLREGLSDLVG